jgi:hypothetical protein
MSTLEAVMKFLGSYPVWAKLTMLAGAILIIGVALLAPRTPIDADAQTKPSSPGASGKTVTFKIHGVSGSGLPLPASVRVTAIVNGRPFTYPSLGSVDWLDVGPTMSSQSFQVPAAAQYDIRFEMDVKGGARQVSQETVQVTALPYTGDYRLFPTKADSAGVSRGFTPGASVRFSLEPAP